MGFPGKHIHSQPQRFTWGRFGRSRLLAPSAKEPFRSARVVPSIWSLGPGKSLQGSKVRGRYKVEEKHSPGLTWEGGRISQSLAGVCLIGLAHRGGLSKLFSVNAAVFMVFQLSLFSLGLFVYLFLCQICTLCIGHTKYMPPE